MNYELILLLGISVTSQIFITYFFQRAKNIATRHDIEQITNKIENVKIQYTKELEKLKSDLQTSVFKHNKITDLSITVLLSFYDSVINLVRVKMATTYTYPSTNDLKKEILSRQHETINFFNEFIICSHKAELILYDNPSLSKNLLELKASIASMFAIYFAHKDDLLDAHVQLNTIKNDEEAIYYTDIRESTTRTIDDYEFMYNPLNEKFNVHLDIFSDKLLNYIKNNS